MERTFWTRGRITTMCMRPAMVSTLSGSIGSIEAKFYAELLRLTGLEREELPHQNNRAEWPALTEKLESGKDSPRLDPVDALFPQVLKKSSPEKAGQDPGGVERTPGGQRYLLRARPEHGRRAQPSAQPGARHVWLTWLSRSRVFLSRLRLHVSAAPRAPSSARPPARASTRRRPCAIGALIPES